MLMFGHPNPRLVLNETQVLPAFAPRLAVTLWFYGRQLGLPRVPPAVPVRRSPSGPAAIPEQLKPGDDTRDKVRPLPTPDGSGASHAAEVGGWAVKAGYRWASHGRGAGGGRARGGEGGGRGGGECPNV